MITLYPKQQEGRDLLLKALQEYGAALDASDTGTGKTYTACAVVREMGVDTLVVCPKSVVSTWTKVAGDTGCVLHPVTYEKLRTGNTGYLTKVKMRGKKHKFQWHLPPGSLVIFDEAHRCSGYESQTSVLCAMTKAYRLKTLLLSATIAESPLKLRAAGFLLGLHNYQDSYSWLMRNGCRKGYFGGIDPPPPHKLEAVMNRIRSEIFPERGYRIRSADLPEFPETLIEAVAYDLPAPAKLNAVCLRLRELVAEASGSGMTEQLRLRQEVEYYKIPVFRELVADAVEEGMSVAVFVSFLATLDALHEAFPDAARIDGQVPVTQRSHEIDRFQSGQTQVFICTISAGGSGISLHDLHGDRPRMALISPTFNAQEMKQVLGRVHRAGGKSKSIQRIVYGADTVEETVAARMNGKLKAMEAFNDGDLLL